MKDLKVDFVTAEPNFAQFAFLFIRDAGDHLIPISGTVTFDLLCDTPVLWSCTGAFHIIGNEDRLILAKIGVMYGEALQKEKFRRETKNENARRRRSRRSQVKGLQGT